MFSHDLPWAHQRENKRCVTRNMMCNEGHFILQSAATVESWHPNIWIRAKMCWLMKSKTLWRAFLTHDFTHMWNGIEIKWPRSIAKPECHAYCGWPLGSAQQRGGTSGNAKTIKDHSHECEITTPQGSWSYLNHLTKCSMIIRTVESHKFYHYNTIYEGPWRLTVDGQRWINKGWISVDPPFTW